MPGPVIHDQGRAWRVVEYLEDCRSWVLVAIDQAAVIQADQFGDPRRRVPVTRLVAADAEPQLYQQIQASMAGLEPD